MPIYVYEPTIYSESEITHNCCYFEKLQRVDEIPLNSCPTCQKPIHRSISSFHFAKVFNEKKQSQFETKEKNISSAGNAAQLATRHICSSGCQH